MSGNVFQAPAELVRPDYVIHKYTDNIYKIVYFKRTQRCIVPKTRTDAVNSEKFSQSVSRARKSILELALCNDWKYFITLTLDASKYDRSDLEKFRTDLSQFIRDLRKKYRKQGFSKDIYYLLVPEQHKDGAWHIHGLLSDISPFTIPFYCLRQQGHYVPDKLSAGFYFDWPDYHKKFGFCSLGIIRDKVATGFYVTKYLSKHLDYCPVSVGDHLYFASHGLNRSTLHGDCYGYCAELDKYLTHDYEFCKTGFTSTSDGVSWDFGLEYMNVELLEQFTFTDSVSFPEIDYQQTYFSLL